MSPRGDKLAATNWNRTISIWDSADRSSPTAKRAMFQAAEEHGLRR